jgi:hypothetical protein
MTLALEPRSSGWENSEKVAQMIAFSRHSCEKLPSKPPEPFVRISKNDCYVHRLRLDGGAQAELSWGPSEQGTVSGNPASGAMNDPDSVFVSALKFRPWLAVISHRIRPISQ